MGGAPDPKAMCYRFRRDDGEILYIGVTTDIEKRLKEHQPYWSIGESITVDVMPVPFAERYQIETALIRRYRPTENRKVAFHANEYENCEERWIPYMRLKKEYWRGRF